MARKKRIQKKQPHSADSPRGKQITISEDWHEVFAIALAGAGLLSFLSLISFVPEEFPPWSSAMSREEVRNFVGPVGVTAAGGALFLFGAAAYLLPVLAIGGAVDLLVRRRKASWASMAALLIWLVSACCLLEYQSLFFQDWVERYALPASEGGFLGAVAGRRVLAGSLGQPGATVVASIVYLLSLTVGTGYRPFRRRPAGRTAPRTVLPPQELKPQALAVAPSPRIIPPPVQRDAGLQRPETQPPPRQPDELPVRPMQKRVERKVPRMVIVDTAARIAEPVHQPSAWIREQVSADSNYRLPSLGLLAAPECSPADKSGQDSLRACQSVIIETLRNFRVRVEPGDITRGPSVTRYEFYPERGLSVRRIAALESDIALATRAKRLNILAPIPGKDTVGIELANDERVPVGLRELLQAGAFADAKAQIPLALGKDVYGKVLVADLAAMPHLLIAGATGSGKSVCLNTVIASLLYRFRPEELRLIMIDPKVVEMQIYARLPHLAVPVVTEPKKVIAALRWCLNEMERRYRLFSEAGVRKLDEYNAKATTGSAAPGSSSGAQGELFKEEDYFLPGNGSRLPASRLRDNGETGGGAVTERLPRIVVIIDELADLMQAAPAEVEMGICRLCQKARAAGMHVIVATQSPRADVVTGLIKANIPARIAFQVSSGTDSRVILDKSGAERLIGKGDLLFQPPDSPVLVRAQGAFLSDEEVERLVEHCARQSQPVFDNGMRTALEMDSFLEASEELNEDDEDAFQKALELIREERRASTSFLQRRMRLGYTRAARLMDLLEERGVVGPAEGAKPREILVADPAAED